MFSFTEENYLKAILELTLEQERKNETGTNELAQHLGVKPATASDMLKRLKEKAMINYEKYGKISLTDDGRKKALEILRKHRLWETFLYKKLEFSWDEIHEVAEQLEHIQSYKLVDKLDEFLEYPKFDPHGDFIPDKNGEIPILKTIPLSECSTNKKYQLANVGNHTTAFLQILDKTGIAINCSIEILEIRDFDKSMIVEIDHKNNIMLSNEVAKNLLMI